jgi:hypothetical protein
MHEETLTQVQNELAAAELHLAAAETAHDGIPRSIAEAERLQGTIANELGAAKAHTARARRFIDNILKPGRMANTDA